MPKRLGGVLEFAAVHPHAAAGRAHIANHAANGALRHSGAAPRAFEPGLARRVRDDEVLQVAVIREFRDLALVEPDAATGPADVEAEPPVMAVVLLRPRLGPVAGTPHGSRHGPQNRMARMNLSSEIVLHLRIDLVDAWPTMTVSASPMVNP